MISRVPRLSQPNITHCRQFSRSSYPGLRQLGPKERLAYPIVSFKIEIIRQLLLDGNSRSL